MSNLPTAIMDPLCQPTLLLCMATHLALNTQTMKVMDHHPILTKLAMVSLVIDIRGLRQSHRFRNNFILSMCWCSLMVLLRHHWEMVPSIQKEQPPPTQQILLLKRSCQGPNLQCQGTCRRVAQSQLSDTNTQVSHMQHIPPSQVKATNKSFCIHQDTF